MYFLNKSSVIKERYVLDDLVISIITGYPSTVEQKLYSFQYLIFHMIKNFILIFLSIHSFFTSHLKLTCHLYFETMEEIEHRALIKFFRKKGLSAMEFTDMVNVLGASAMFCKLAHI